MLKVFEPDISPAPKWSPANLLKKNPPEFRLIKGQLPKLNPKAIESAVESLISEIDIKGDKIGFFNQTLKTIANSTILGGAGDFWIAEEDGDVMAYATAHFCTDIDDRLTYYVPQAWIHPQYRRHKIFKSWWNKIRQRAKDCLAAHLVIVSARNPKAFIRLLGNDMHQYATLIKSDLGE